jgi:putative ABC transport system ATP-binding protein
VNLQNLRVTLPSLAGDVNILKGIDLQVEAGDVVGLTGPSGSGKTTLLMVLAGLEPPTGGEVMMAGKNFTQMNEDELARFRRLHIGIVFQSFHLIPTMTAEENTALPLELAGEQSGILDRARAMLDEVGLAHRMDHYPGQLSGGEQQRVALARAMIANPPIMLADEPTGNLDQSTGEQIMDLIFTMQSQRKSTLLLITHDPVLAGRCDRVVRLRDGQVDNG